MGKFLYQGGAPVASSDTPAWGTYEKAAFINGASGGTQSTCLSLLDPVSWAFGVHSDLSGQASLVAVERAASFYMKFSAGPLPADILDYYAAHSGTVEWDGGEGPYPIAYPLALMSATPATQALQLQPGADLSGIYAQLSHYFVYVRSPGTAQQEWGIRVVGDRSAGGNGFSAPIGSAYPADGTVLTFAFDAGQLTLSSGANVLAAISAAESFFYGDVVSEYGPPPDYDFVAGHTYEPSDMAPVTFTLYSEPLIEEIYIGSQSIPPFTPKFWTRLQGCTET